MFVYIEGDLIVGLEAVNSDWWRGLVGENVGIFPLTHVEEINLQLSSPAGNGLRAVAPNTGDSINATLCNFAVGLD